MEHDHSPEAIQVRLAGAPRHTYLRDRVYGGIDCAVTTFAVVAGVMGAELSPGIVLDLGVANLVADGFSMAANNYFGAEHDSCKILAHRWLRTPGGPQNSRVTISNVVAWARA